MSSGSLHVRIVAVPPGEAPLEVREKWVGLVLPLYAGEVGARDFETSGVMSGPRSYWGYWWRRLFRSLEVTHGFAVDAAGAMEILEAREPRATEWWLKNAAALVQPGRALIFHAHVGVLVQSSSGKIVGTEGPPDPESPGGPYTSDVDP